VLVIGSYHRGESAPLCCAKKSLRRRYGVVKSRGLKSEGNIFIINLGTEVRSQQNFGRRKNAEAGEE
jgi:hypothetical protein